MVCIHLRAPVPILRTASALHQLLAQGFEVPFPFKVANTVQNSPV